MLTVFKWSLLTKCNLYTLLKDSFKSVSSPGLFVFDLAQAESVHILHSENFIAHSEASAAPLSICSQV